MTSLSVNLDFSFPEAGGSPTPGDIDNDGTAETVERATVRWIIHDPFKETPDASTVKLFIREVLDDQTLGEREIAWRLVYRNAADLVVNPDGTRTITMAPGRATVDLSEEVWTVQRNGRLRHEQEYRGTYDMPFSITVGVIEQ